MNNCGIFLANFIEYRLKDGSFKQKMAKKYNFTINKSIY